jgi:hypothetical protein
MIAGQIKRTNTIVYSRLWAETIRFYRDVMGADENSSKEKWLLSEKFMQVMVLLMVLATLRNQVQPRRTGRHASKPPCSSIHDLSEKSLSTEITAAKAGHRLFSTDAQR